MSREILNFFEYFVVCFRSVSQMLCLTPDRTECDFPKIVYFL